MTAPAEGTAVAAPEKLGVGDLPAHIRAALQLRKMQNVVAAELGKLNWGSKVDDSTRRAVADWCGRNDVDPATELDVLGNKFYKNASYYLRKLSEMTHAGLVEYAVADHVEHDDRLAKLAELDTEVGPKAQAELDRRLFVRIDRAIPDKAAAAVVFRVKLRSMEQEVTGVAFCGGGTRKNDPVGDDRPGPTAETRAARRCIRQIATAHPDLAASMETGEEEAKTLGERISEQVKQIDAQRPAYIQPMLKQVDGPYAPPAVQDEDDAA